MTATLTASVKRPLVAFVLTAVIALGLLLALGTSAGSSASGSARVAQSAPLSAAEADATTGRIQCAGWIVRAFYIALASGDRQEAAFWYGMCLLD